MGRTACKEPQCLYKGDLYLYLLCLDGYFMVCGLTNAEIGKRIKRKNIVAVAYSVKWRW